MLSHRLLAPRSLPSLGACEVLYISTTSSTPWKVEAYAFNSKTPIGNTYFFRSEEFNYFSSFPEGHSTENMRTNLESKVQLSPAKKITFDPNPCRNCGPKWRHIQFKASIDFFAFFIFFGRRIRCSAGYLSSRLLFLSRDPILAHSFFFVPLS